MNVVVVAKPEWVSWDTISNVLHKAHIHNKENGFIQNTVKITGEEIEKKVRSGQCFVAMDGDNVVGTLSVAHKNKKAWFFHGRALYYMLLGILPEYQGKGIYSKLIAAREEYTKANYFEVTYMYTAEKNLKMQQLAQKEGFRLVSYSVFPKTDYYSVELAKWHGKCPFPEWYCNMRFQMSKFFMKLRYKPGAAKRFL